ncbi:MAG: hypothetical protein N3E49_06880 [Bacteroidia bacterium]|nr:hypothetical protein [Bacteroidia bacterium]
MIKLPPFPPEWAVVRPNAPMHAPVAPVILIDLVEPQTGELIEDIELLLYKWKATSADRCLGLHITYWFMGLAYGHDWEVDFLLYHEPTFQQLWGLSLESDILPEIKGWAPPPKWHLLSPTYRPTLSIIERANTYLRALQDFRRRLVGYQPHHSTLYRTVTEDHTFLHYSLSDIERHVAALRS